MFNVGGTDNLLTAGQQIPLELSNGMTIHKSQGMNLEKVIVDCRKINQTGVAIGRATRVDGLQVLNFRK